MILKTLWTNARTRQIAEYLTDILQTPNTHTDSCTHSEWETNSSHLRKWRWKAPNNRKCLRFFFSLEHGDINKGQEFRLAFFLPVPSLADKTLVRFSSFLERKCLNLPWYLQQAAADFEKAGPLSRNRKEKRFSRWLLQKERMRFQGRL